MIILQIIPAVFFFGALYYSIKTHLSLKKYINADLEERILYMNRINNSIFTIHRDLEDHLKRILVLENKK